MDSKLRLRSTRNKNRPTERQRSLIASSPMTNIFRTARNAEMRTLSPAEDQRSSRTCYRMSASCGLAEKHTLRYALKCFLAPKIHGRSLVLSRTADSSNPPVSSPSDGETLDGEEGRDLMR